MPRGVFVQARLETVHGNWQDACLTVVEETSSEAGGAAMA